MRISDWSSDVCSSDLHGRLIAATTIAGGAGLGAGGFRTDTQAVCGVEPSQAAAAGADGVYVHHRRADLIAGNEAFRPDERPALADEGNVGAGAADVDAYEIADAIQRAGVLCADNTGRRPREKQAHRAPFCRFASGSAAARLHDLEAAG